MRMSKQHEVLTDGVGKCSVPMWMGGVPAGLCDERAFGKQEEDQLRYGRWIYNGSWGSGRRWYPGYCGGLACHRHGGPEEPDSQQGEG